MCVRVCVNMSACDKLCRVFADEDPHKVRNMWTMYLLIFKEVARSAKLTSTLFDVKYHMTICDNADY